MRPVATGTTYRKQVQPTADDLASALGNTGVDVVSSPATIGYLEMACHEIIDPCFEEDEASVGIGFNFRHLAAARVEAPLLVCAELISQGDGRFTFKVEARQAGSIIMTGEHERALINLERFLTGPTARRAPDKK